MPYFGYFAGGQRVLYFHFIAGVFGGCQRDLCFILVFVFYVFTTPKLKSLVRQIEFLLFAVRINNSRHYLLFYFKGYLLKNFFRMDFLRMYLFIVNYCGIFICDNIADFLDGPQFSLIKLHHIFFQLIMDLLWYWQNYKPINMK